jgi:hypothetical protein
MNRAGDLVVLCNVSSPPRDDAHPAYDLCPREWEVEELDPVRTLQDLVITKYEFAFFAEIARAWNQAPKSWKAFPEFLRLVYSNRILHESDVKLEEEDSEDAATVPFTNSQMAPALARIAA